MPLTIRLFHIRKLKDDVDETADDDVALEQVSQDYSDGNANIAGQSGENNTDSEADAIETKTKPDDTVYDNVGGKQCKNTYLAYLVIS